VECAGGQAPLTGGGKPRAKGRGALESRRSAQKVRTCENIRLENGFGKQGGDGERTDKIKKGDKNGASMFLKNAPVHKQPATEGTTPEKETEGSRKQPRRSP